MDLSELLNGYVKSPTLSIEHERLVIRKAKEGDEEAYRQLLTCYAPVLKKTIRNSTSTASKEDIEAAVLLGFVETVNDFDEDKHVSIGSIINHRMMRAMSETGAQTTAFTVKKRSLSRWSKINREAEGDVFKAMALAPKYEMSVNTYMDIRNALQETGSLEAITLGGDYVVHSLHIVTESPVGESDEDLLNIVFEIKGDENDITKTEAEILRRHAGFHNYGDQQTDNAIGDVMGMGRATVQRARKRAIDKAQRRLGVSK